MIPKSEIKSAVFFDIETRSAHRSLAELDSADPYLASAFTKKVGHRFTEDHEDNYFRYASLYPEYGKILCMSFGVYAEGVEKVSCISGDELEVVQKAHAVFTQCGDRGMRPCGWNIKNFDIPWLVRKFMMYKMPVPHVLRTFGKKPWEMVALDLKEAYKCCSDLNITFEEASLALGVNCSKHDSDGGIDGSMVNSLYWNSADREAAVSRICNYCDRDVRSSMQLAVAMSDM